MTADSIKVVYIRIPIPEFLEPTFRAGGLAASEEEEQLSLDTWTGFFNKRLELYGRKIDPTIHILDCQSNEGGFASCSRQQARVIKKKYDPLWVFVFGGSGAVELHDELSRLGIMSMGGQHLPKKFNSDRRPFHWDLFTDGDLVALNLADYWCKKMVGKAANRAGDPLLAQQTRSLGIVAEVPADGESVFDHAAQRFADLVTGERCGGVDEPDIFTVSNDPATQSNQMTAIAQAFKAANRTTVVCFCIALTPTFMTSAFDEQNYFPEHLMNGAGSLDIDPVGRLYTTSQWRNAFGPGFLPEPIALSETDAGRAWDDMGRLDDEYCLVCGAMWLFYEPIAFTLQMAGPNLSPYTLEAGAFAHPDLGGWETTGGDPVAPMWSFGPDDYTAYADAREVYWDPAATSKIDGRPGAYVASHGGRRWEIARWPAGDPLS